MTDLDFYAEAVVTGRVFGVGPRCELREVEAALGPELRCVNTTRWTLGCQYGLVEFYFSRASRKDPWVCYGVGIMLHRLAFEDYELEEFVPAPLRQRYGQFSRAVRADRLLQAIAEKLGYCEVQYKEHSPEYLSIRVGGTNAELYVVNNPAARRGNGELGYGDVWSIHLLSPRGATPP